MSGFSNISTGDKEIVLEYPFDSGEEADFETLIESNPDSIPIVEINPLARVAVPIGRQVTIGTYALDLLFLDNTGRLLAIECKLIQNPEARREVVAQLLEYANIIEKEWDSNRVKAIADEYLSEKQFDGSLVDYMNQRLEGVGLDKVTDKVLTQRVQSKIKTPFLIVAGNRLEQRAMVLVDYLQKQKVPIVCAEFRRYKVREQIFTLGFVRCAALLTTTSSSQRQAISEEEWLALFETEPIKSVREDLLQWVKTLSTKTLGVHRVGSKELMFDMTRNGRKKNVISISDRVYFQFGNLRALGIQASDIDGFRQTVDAVLGIGVLSSRSEYPSVPVTALSQPEKREQIKARFSELLVKVPSGAPNLSIDPT